MNLANALRDTGVFSEAERTYARITELAPEDETPLTDRAYCLLKLDRIPEALELMDALIARAPDSPSGYHNKAELLCRLKRYTEAEHRKDSPPLPA